MCQRGTWLAPVDIGAWGLRLEHRVDKANLIRSVWGQIKCPIDKAKFFPGD